MFKLLSVALVLSGNLTLNAQTWIPVGPGSYSSTTSAIVIDGSDIYANNTFISGADVFSFGRLTAGTWNALGNWKGFPNGIGSVNCALKVGDDIYVGGSFTDGSGNPDMDKIARWNTITNTWHAMGQGLSNGYVNDIIQFGSDIIIVGKFTDAGGNPNADYIAKWDGTSWSAATSTLISTNSFTSVNTVAVKDNELYFGGNFENAGGNAAADFLTKWDGSSFQDVYGWGAQIGAVHEITFDGNDLYVGGEFPIKIAKHNGTTWDLMDNFSVASGASQINVIEVVGTDVYIGGTFNDVKGITEADNIARYDGSSWNAVAGGLNNTVRKIVASGGDLYVGGLFTDAGGDATADKFVKIGVSTSILEKETNDNTIVYPNPTNGVVTIQLTNNNSKAIELYNVIGELLILNQTNQSKHTIDISNYPNGVYFLKVDGNITKFIKQ